MHLDKACHQRNEYGALTEMPEALCAVARELLAKAIAAKKLKAPYLDMELHRRYGYLGQCLNYDFYDVSASSVLVQRRETERTKYGSSPRKDYYIIRRCGRGVSVIPAPKAVVVKLAKASSSLGEVIRTLVEKGHFRSLSGPAEQAKMA